MRAHGGTAPSGAQTEAAWKRDVALEMWIDVERVPILIRLEGTLEEERQAASSLWSKIRSSTEAETSSWTHPPSACPMQLASLL